MKCDIFSTTSLAILSLMLLQMLNAAPTHYSNDIDYNDSLGGVTSGTGGHYHRNNNPQIDYNTIFSHVKDFFMYLPVMMTTLKETMNGFPKFAEGVRILTSKDGRIESSDCNCDRGSSEISNRQYGHFSVGVNANSESSISNLESAVGINNDSSTSSATIQNTPGDTPPVQQQTSKRKLNDNENDIRPVTLR